MNSEQFYNTERSSDDITYYEEQLLLNYDDYMDAFQAKLTAINQKLRTWKPGRREIC